MTKSRIEERARPSKIVYTEHSSWMRGSWGDKVGLQLGYVTRDLLVKCQESRHSICDCEQLDIGRRREEDDCSIRRPNPK